MDISAIALQGLDQAQTQLDAVASNIVQSSANASSGGANVDTADLATQLVALNSAQIQFQLDLKTLTAADRIQENALNILG